MEHYIYYNIPDKAILGPRFQMQNDVQSLDSSCKTMFKAQILAARRCLEPKQILGMSHNTYFNIFEKYKKWIPNMVGDCTKSTTLLPGPGQINWSEAGLCHRRSQGPAPYPGGGFSAYLHKKLQYWISAQKPPFALRISFNFDCELTTLQYFPAYYFTCPFLSSF